MVSKIPYAEGAAALKQVGTRWVTGGGAEVMDEAFRKRHSPGKYKVADYYKAQRAILDAELGSTATMVIGFGEPLSCTAICMVNLNAMACPCAGLRSPSPLAG
jgi:cyclic dehypoxanthinyl futalosine synthase